MLRPKSVRDKRDVAPGGCPQATGAGWRLGGMNPRKTGPSNPFVEAIRIRIRLEVLNATWVRNLFVRNTFQAPIPLHIHAPCSIQSLPLLHAPSPQPAFLFSPLLQHLTNLPLKKPVPSSPRPTPGLVRHLRASVGQRPLTNSKEGIHMRKHDNFGRA